MPGVRQRNLGLRSRSPRRVATGTPCGGVRQRLGTRPCRSFSGTAPPPRSLSPTRGPHGSTTGTYEWLDFVTTNFLCNAQSSHKVHNMISKAQGAGAQGCEHLEKAGGHGKHTKNLARDMMRTLLRDIDYLEFYLAKIPLNSINQGGKQILVDYPLLLPH